MIAEKEVEVPSKMHPNPKLCVLKTPSENSVLAQTHDKKEIVISK